MLFSHFSIFSAFAENPNFSEVIPKWLPFWPKIVSIEGKLSDASHPIWRVAFEEFFVPQTNLLL